LALRRIIAPPQPDCGTRPDSSISDQSSGDPISGGTISLGTSRQWTVLGFALAPALVEA
jgi:hypothetical protein